MTKENAEVVVVIGAGSIGQAIARRVSAGKHVLFADLHQRTTTLRQNYLLSKAGFLVSTTIVDVSSRQSVHSLLETAIALGNIRGLIHAGVSPSQASPSPILSLDLYGTALVLEEFGKVIMRAEWSTWLMDIET